MPQLTNDRTVQKAGGLLQALLDIAVPNATADTLNKANEMKSNNYSNGGNMAGGNAQSMQGEITERDKNKENMKMLNDLIKSNPILKSTYKAVDDTYKSLVQEAFANGVSGPQILSMAHEQTGIPMPQQTVGQTSPSPVESKPATSLNQQSSIQQQAADITNPQKRNLLGNILNTVGNMTGINAVNAGVDSLRLSNLSYSQQIQGKQPMQIGDYQKEILKQAHDIAKQKMLTPETLMTKFEQAAQPFITQRDAFSRITALSNDPSPAGDLGVIFSYMKLLDPPSTVREGEQATAENARGVPDYLRNLYNKIATGEKLTVKQRADFLNKSRSIFKSAESQQKKTTREFSNLGRRNGIEPKSFIRDTGLAEESNGKEESSGFNTTPGGNKFKVLK